MFYATYVWCPSISIYTNRIQAFEELRKTNDTRLSSRSHSFSPSPLLHLAVPAETSTKYVYYAEENICYDICIQL